ncbi:BREX system ATP-binding protein BrxD [Steroidobacter flavus]|uniref:BREX system ATP-binding protein BrxD n=1 Tax=Steroidobacter flavus TaxID=1842136 RepID=A0ABV8SZD1_9GAMM
MSEPSVLLKKDVIEALRRGTVPRRGLDLFAVGTDRFAMSLKEELDRCATGGAVFKALRGDFGCGKSFTARWYQQQALARGFAVAEVQISENDTPLHRLETVYRRAMEALRTAQWDVGAFRAIISQWLMGLEEEVSQTLADPDDMKALAAGVGTLLEARLKDVSAVQPQYAAVLRAYHLAQIEGEHAIAEGLIAWLMGQPNVSAEIKKRAGIKGEIDHTGALGFLRGLLAVLQQCGRPGLLLVLDEVETIQRVRSDSRDKSLEAIRKLIDDLYGGRFAGLYVLITGTPAFFDGPNGVKRLPPLAQRLHVDFSADAKWDNPRDVQVRLPAFDRGRLLEVGRRVRDLYPTEATSRMQARVTDAVIAGLASAVAGKLGGKVGIAPRIFLRKLVATILDRVDLFADFDPQHDLEIRIDADELTVEERAAAAGKTPDEIEINL